MEADILCGSAATIENAKATYRRLLEKYPNYPFIAEIRRKLKEMDEDRRIGSVENAQASFFYL